MVFHPEFRTSFDRQLNKLTRRNLQLKKRVKEAVERLLESPYDQSETYRKEYIGKRKHRIGDYRIAFSICEECRKNKHQKHNGCSDCEKFDNRTLMFFAIFHKGRSE